MSTKGKSTEIETTSGFARAEDWGEGGKGSYASRDRVSLFFFCMKILGNYTVVMNVQLYKYLKTTEACACTYIYIYSLWLKINISRGLQALISYISNNPNSIIRPTGTYIMQLFVERCWFNDADESFTLLCVPQSQNLTERRGLKRNGIWHIRAILHTFSTLLILSFRQPF